MHFELKVVLSVFGKHVAFFMVSIRMIDVFMNLNDVHWEQFYVSREYTRNLNLNQSRMHRQRNFIVIELMLKYINLCTIFENMKSKHALMNLLRNMCDEENFMISIETHILRNVAVCNLRGMSIIQLTSLDGMKSSKCWDKYFLIKFAFSR